MINDYVSFPEHSMTFFQILLVCLFQERATSRYESENEQTDSGSKNNTTVSTYVLVEEYYGQRYVPNSNVSRKTEAKLQSSLVSHQ